MVDLILVVALGIVVGGLLWIRRHRATLELAGPDPASGASSQTSTHQAPSTGSLGALARRAGFGTDTVPRVIPLLRVGLGLATAAAGVAADAPLWAVLAMAGSAGALPDLALRLLARRRRRAIEQALSFFLDLVLSLLQAGVGMEEAFRVAAQTGLSPGHPLATEAAQLGADLAIGRDRSTAFLLLAARSGAPSLTALANTVAEGLRRGVSFERLLTTHAELARARRREAATKRLELANAEILLPLLLCGLPSFVVLVVLPLGLQVYEALTGVAAVLGP